MATYHSSELLEKTLLIAQYNEDAEGDGGGVARVLRKMADCLSWMGKSKEAEDYHRRAETIRNRIQNGQLDRGDDEQSYDMLVSTFYRWVNGVTGLAPSLKLII